MYPIVRKETLADNIILMDIKAPRVAAECLPGQFIIAKTDEVGERIPLTICDYDREKETVTIVVQTIGAGTERMMSLNEGDALEDFVGPLGKATETDGLKKVAVVGGGVGCAIAYPVAKINSIPVAENCLVRTRDTGRQSDINDINKRAGNVRGAFEVSTNWDVTGLRVVVVDDVATTGATLHEAAKVLYKAGAAKVLCVAFAGNRNVKNAEPF